MTYKHETTLHRTHVYIHTFHRTHVYKHTFHRTCIYKQTHMLLSNCYHLHTPSTRIHSALALKCTMSVVVVGEVLKMNPVRQHVKYE